MLPECCMADATYSLYVTLHHTVSAQKFASYHGDLDPHLIHVFGPTRPTTSNGSSITSHSSEIRSH